MKIQIDLNGLRNLVAASRRAGTQEKIIDLLLEWAEEATAEIEGLHKPEVLPCGHPAECMRASVDTVPSGVTCGWCRERDELLDSLTEMVNAACNTEQDINTHEEDLCSWNNPSNAHAIRLLVKCGKVEVVKDYGHTVMANWKKNSVATLNSACDRAATPGTPEYEEVIEKNREVFERLK